MRPRTPDDMLTHRAGAVVEILCYATAALTEAARGALLATKGPITHAA
jgi:hypothetical protein